MNATDLLIRKMQRQELDVLIDWAAREGWNPGVHDAELFWAADPDGFVAAELDGEIVGGGSIVSYGGQYGFMGLFIVHPRHRGRGLGDRLWHERLRRLSRRLSRPAVIGMDGVFDMQHYYAKGGFRFAGRDLRFAGIARHEGLVDSIVSVSEVAFDALANYDRAHFPAPRDDFLRRWIGSPGSHARCAFKDGKCAGFGVMRPCRTGFKIGPLFADNATIARNLLHALCAQVAGAQVFLDVPERNQAALDLARGEGMKEVFGCAKMYYGEAPALPEHEIFGVTTFELG